MRPEAQKIDYVSYILDLIKYAGGFLQRLGNLGAVIRDSFSDISLPKKQDYVK